MNSPRSFRTTELVKEFSRQGHEVTLITFYNPIDHDAFADEFGFTIKQLGDEKHFKIKPSNIIITLIRKVLYRMFDYPNISLMFLVKKALKEEKGYDLLLSIGAPHSVHWGVAWARNKTNPIAKKWLADCGDPYMGNKVAKKKKLFYFMFLEKWFCRKADIILVPLKDAIDAYYAEFQKKIRVVPQGFNFNETKMLLKEYSENKIITFAYTGNFIVGQRDPRPILDFLLKTKNNFKFIIYTKSTKLIEPYQEILKDKLIVNSYIPREELIPILSQMDFLVNIENNVKEQRPSKLIDYALTERPILSLSSNNLDTDNFNRFLNKDYSQKMIIDSINQFDIVNVSREILKYGL